jgi:hypothetical protein
MRGGEGGELRKERWHERSRECRERQDSHQAERASERPSVRSFVRSFVRSLGHLFRDDSQMLDRSSRYNPTSGQTG